MEDGFDFLQGGGIWFLRNRRDDVSIQVDCIQVLGGQYSLVLSYYKNPKDTQGIYWKLSAIAAK